MTAASRRRARRNKQTRIDQAQARVDARRAARDAARAAGLNPSPKIWTRKDHEALNSEYGPTGGTKQRYKHANKRHAKAMARRDATYARMRVALIAATADLPVRMTDLVMFGSQVPTIGWGTAVDSAGNEWLWKFRYRYDNAFLEVGVSDGSDWQPLVTDCHYAASRDDVHNDPYRGWLTEAQGVTLLTGLFSELAPPLPGERFSERLKSSLDALLGRLDDTDDAPSTPEED
ncbi:hypothetical protein [Paenarthrobacter sp. C1]|uniref:hypothetical protein n=1 Tax=Paenarthrobacter sp. C1 TaxID=3400220 RepID=UPI003BF54DBB